MPVWLQVVLPIFTALLGGAVGVGFGQFGKALDRRRERREAAAAAAARAEWSRAVRLREWLPRFSVDLYEDKHLSLSNRGWVPATGISITFDGYPRKSVKDLPDEPFTLDKHESVDFYLPGTENWIDLPQMWVMCAEYAEPVPIQMPEKWPW